MKAVLSSIIYLTMMITTVKSEEPANLLYYLVREPKVKSDKAPLLILLHGVGSNEEDLFSFAQQLPDKYLIVSARAPITLGANSYAWYQVDFSTGKPIYNTEQEVKSRNLIISFIEQMKKKNVDENEIYLLGFSQGAIMSYSVALTRPDLIKGIAVMSGRLLEELKVDIAHVDKLTKLKVYISHGINDNVLLIQEARNANAFLKTKGVFPVYKEYQAGHEISSTMLTDLISWLKGTSK